jgi:2-oxoglutarate dehydrogenase E2 component (dihydrolipoamide succinyltransferase)
MSIEVKVPVLPESVSDATIAAWHKKPGDTVRRDENLLDLETDKVVLEVPSPVDGVLKELKFKQGDTVTSSQVVRDHRGRRGCRRAGVRPPPPRRRPPRPRCPACCARRPPRPDRARARPRPGCRPRRELRRAQRRQSRRRRRHRPRRPRDQGDVVNYVKSGGGARPDRACR